MTKLEELIGFDNTFDITRRTIKNIKGLEFNLYFNPFLIDSLKVSRLVTSFIKIKDKINYDNFEDEVMNYFISESIVKTNDLNETANAIFNGDLIITLINSNCCFYMETKNYPSRSIAEPDGEKVVRGSRDGFTEIMAVNIGLIRRRIKSKNLCMEEYVIGKISQTKVILVYLKDVIKEEVLRDIKNKLDNIKIKELTMSDKALEELLLNNTYTPFPLVKYTERPDTFAMHLYQGMFGLIVDTSPSAILAPITVFDHLQHAEEYRQNIVAGSYLRVLRTLCIIISFFIMPLWYALSSINALPSFLGNIIPKNESHTTLFFKLITIEIGIEVIRMASIHTPSALSSSMGLISGLILGDLAIKLGLFNEELVLLGAISSIGSYINPSYELGLASKMTKLVILVFVFLFKMWGFILSIFLAPMSINIRCIFEKIRRISSSFSQIGATHINPSTLTPSISAISAAFSKSSSEEKPNLLSSFPTFTSSKALVIIPC